MNDILTAKTVDDGTACAWEQTRAGTIRSIGALAVDGVDGFGVSLRVRRGDREADA